MNIYLVSQNKDIDYETYDSAVVVAHNETAARQIHPATGEGIQGWNPNNWVRHPEELSVKLLGKATKGIKPGVILASYNAG